MRSTLLQVLDNVIQSHHLMPCLGTVSLLWARYFLQPIIAQGVLLCKLGGMRWYTCCR